MTAPTMRYWAQQLGIGYGVIALSAYVALVLLTVVLLETRIWFPFRLGLGMLFTLERLVTVWKGGWKARILATNTVIYASLALVNLLPRIYPTDWITNRNRRTKTPSIYPGYQAEGTGCAGDS